jgi:membrane fusion protein (multidrug efflux system)
VTTAEADDTLLVEQPTEQTGHGESPRGMRPWFKRPLAIAAASVALVLGAGVGGRAYVHALSHESTDDAFVEGRVVQMSPRVAGHVAKLLVSDNQHVAAGQVLVEIDDRDFRARLDQARAALDSAKGKQAAAQAQLDLVTVTSGADLTQAKAGESQARSALETSRAQVTAAESALAEAGARVSAMQAAVDEARADVVAAQAEQHRAATELKRFEQMHDKLVASDQELENVQAASRTADAKVDAAGKKVAAAEASVAQAKAAKTSAAAAVAQAQSSVGQAEAKVAEARAHVEAADVAPQRVQSARSELRTASADVARLEAQVHQAELDLSYTRITAPEAGRVTRRTVEDGNYVQPGQAMFALVPQDMWVIANFKETQLDHMRPGQNVDVKVDAYPELHLKAHVDSVQRGTGARFSLLPPENATGNYVKVVQRVPVKIVFDQAPGDQYPIGPGMSVEPEVNVK